MKSIVAFSAIAATVTVACNCIAIDFNGQKDVPVAAPSELTVEYRKNPIGIDEVKPRLSWKLPQDVVAQTAYEIESGSWTSGKVFTDRSICVPWSGPSLGTGERRSWRVRIWDQDGRVSKWSAISFFTMGIMADDRWRARWIAAEDEEMTPRFVKRFGVKEGLRRAILMVTGLGFYEAELNGRRVGSKLLDPSPTDYDKRVLYSTYELPDLRHGTNELSIVVGHGWYHMRTVGWDFTEAPWRDRPCAIAQLRLEYSSGEIEYVLTDDTWDVCQSGLSYDDVREGEVYDARIDQVTVCAKARVWKGPRGMLVAERQPGAEIVEKFEPKAIHDLGKGSYFIDFGVDLAGWVRCSFRGLSRGDCVTMCYDERSEGGIRPPVNRVIDQFSNVFGSTNVIGSAGRLQTNHYISDGSGDERYEPRFTYHGFRYLTVSGLRNRPHKEDFTAVAINTAFDVVGCFESSDEMLNKLVRATDRSYRSNWTDGVPTDCPHREKNGWTGDASLASELAQYLYENTAGYEKWLYDLVDAQREDGMLPGIAPTGGWGCDFKGWGEYPGPCWDGALTMVPWMMYLYRDDDLALKISYPAIRKNVTFWENVRKANENGLIPAGLGDWCAPVETNKAPTRFVTTAWHYSNLRRAERIAATLKESSDAVLFRKWAHATRESINRAFYLPSAHAYADEMGRGYQTMSAMALAFDLVPEEGRTGVENALLKEIADKDDHLDVGIFGLKVILRQLSAMGRTDLALKMLLRQTPPSFAEWIRLGSTTLREHYGTEQSWNHIMFGDFVAWAYQHLAGIRIDDEDEGRAFRRILLAPEPVEALRFVRVSVNTPYGMVKSFWRKAGASCVYAFSVPPNTRAEIRFGGVSKSFGTGEYELSEPWEDVVRPNRRLK